MVSGKDLFTFVAGVLGQPIDEQCSLNGEAAGAGTTYTRLIHINILI